MRERAEKEGKMYYAVRAWLLEIKVLEWMDNSEEVLKVIKRIEKYILKNGKIQFTEKPLIFNFLISKGIANAMTLKYKEAIKYARKCEKMVDSLPYIYRIELINLYSFLEDNRKALKHLNKIKKLLLEDKDNATHAPIVIYTIAGDIKSADEFYRKLKGIDPGIGASSGILVCKALNELMRANLKRAEYYARESLNKAKYGGARGYIYTANLILASIYSALGLSKEKTKILESTLKLMKKYSIHSYMESIEYLTGRNKDAPPYRKDVYSRAWMDYLLIKTAEFPSKRNIRELFEYAEKTETKGIFHREILLFPEIANKALEYGIKPPFSKRFLKLPCFNKDIPVFYIKFLGPLRIYKKGKLMSTKLSPRECSFLIFLSCMREKKCFKGKIIRNYWKDKKYSEQYLYNLISSLRKKLGIHSHLLYLKKNYLYNEVNFHTDWDEFQNHIANAHALLRMGEKKFSKRAFFNAFRLVRGKPFEKMYDNWSEDMRDYILSRIRNETENYKRAFPRGEVPSHILELFSE